MSNAKPLTLEQFENNTAAEWASGAYHADIRATVEDNARLRALIRAAEWDGNHEGAACCPWCERNWSAPLALGAKHDDECSAFTSSGEVR